MELATTRSAAQPGGLTLKLGEDVEWLHELSMDMDPEDGCIWVYGVGEDGVVAFTRFGIECLQEIISDLRATGQAKSLPCRRAHVRPPHVRARSNISRQTVTQSR